MKTKRLLEYLKILKSIAGKRHKGRNGTICKILASMEKEAQLPWWKKPGQIEIPEPPKKKAIEALDGERRDQNG